MRKVMRSEVNFLVVCFFAWFFGCFLRVVSGSQNCLPDFQNGGVTRGVTRGGVTRGGVTRGCPRGRLGVRTSSRTFGLSDFVLAGPRGRHPGVLTGTRKKPAKVCRERVCYEAQKAREGVSEKVPGGTPGTFRERAANSNSGFPAQILSPEFKKPRKLDSKTNKKQKLYTGQQFPSTKSQKHSRHSSNFCT
jgi:hypothetical protein